VMKPYGFTLSALGDEARLLDLLSQESLSHVSETFYVNKEWLIGNSDYAVKTEMYWYKNLYEAAETVLHCHEKGFHPQVIFIKRDRANLANLTDDGSTIKPTNSSGTEYIGIVVRLRRSAEDGIQYTTYRKRHAEDHCSR
jgi:hypothetical protein